MSIETPPIAEATPVSQVAHELDSSYRSAVLQDLLGPDLEFAQNTGLIDMFDYNANTGEDGLLHTLSGVIIQGQNGGKVAQGFHHEPSAEIVWPVPEGVDSQGKPYVAPTRVDNSYPGSLKSKERSQFRQYPYESYAAVTYVGGVKKLGTGRDSQTGEAKVVTARSGMFPKEYDPLAVLQTIRMAYNNRTQASPSYDNENRAVTVAEGYAPMLDGSSLMKIRMVLDPETQKIRTAVPTMKPGVMKLSRAAIRGHLGLE